MNAGVLQALLGLALVLAAIGAAAWALRRLGGARPLAGVSPLAIKGVLALGPRERVVVV